MLDGSNQNNVLAERRAQRQLEDRGALRVEDVGACVDVLLTTPSPRREGRDRRRAAHSNMMEAHPGPSRQPRQC